jgi:hypothetical protein
MVPDPHKKRCQDGAAGFHELSRTVTIKVYPEPQNAPYVSAGINVPDSLQEQYHKATGVSPWYGVCHPLVPLVRIGASGLGGSG